MNEKDFLENYLWPSDDRLDRTFTHPLPKIEGLKKCGDFIVQCEHEDTFSTNIMTKYESNTSGVRLVDVYKCSENKVTGVFVRLVGTNEEEGRRLLEDQQMTVATSLVDAAEKAVGFAREGVR